MCNENIVQNVNKLFFTPKSFRDVIQSANSSYILSKNCYMPQTCLVKFDVIYNGRNML